MAARQFLAVGLAASSDASVRLLRPTKVSGWRKALEPLHKLVYLSGMGGALHYWMLVKSDTRLPLTFAFVIALLLGFRLFIKYYRDPGDSPASVVPQR